MSIRIEVHHFFHPAGDVLAVLQQITHRIEAMMATNEEVKQQILQAIADTRADVAAVKTVEGSVKALLEGLNARIADLIAQGQSGALDPTQILAAMGDLKNGIVEAKDALASDVVANTPAQ